MFFCIDKVPHAVGQAAKDKKLAPFRWMGCVLAVYECAIPSESGRKPRKGTRRPSSKRRGRRSGRKERKRRAVVRGVPSNSGSAPSKGLAPASRLGADILRGRSHCRRVSYMAGRYNAWSMSRVHKLVYLSSVLDKNRTALKELAKGLPWTRTRFLSLRKIHHEKKTQFHKLKDDWVATSARKQQETRDFAWTRLKVLLKCLGAKNSFFSSLHTKRDTPVVVSVTPPPPVHVVHHCNDLCDSDCDEGITLQPVRQQLGRGRRPPSHKRPVVVNTSRFNRRAPSGRT